MKIKGYGPGTGRQFTPSVNATWTEEFNQLLQEYHATHNYSRNGLTEKLVQLGMRALKDENENKNNKTEVKNGILIPIEGLDESHLEFLNSKEGQDTIKGMVKLLLLGGQTNIEPTIFKPSPTIEASATHENTEQPEQNQKPKTDINKLIKRSQQFGGLHVSSKE